MIGEVEGAVCDKTERVKCEGEEGPNSKITPCGQNLTFRLHYKEYSLTSIENKA